MSRYVCIHGHFYQPPRENPWLEEIEAQDSAAPYHDWNERISAECYAPNAASRILNDQKQIVDIVNNYSSLSFNFGPTLLSWLEKYDPHVYEAILEADRSAQKKFSGHGSALAQAYNHLIMPLANRRDKETQVIWGIKDFEGRFKRKPEGMWLPETAVDLETLEILAEHKIKFTILSPFQARRVKNSDKENWQDVKGGKIDSQIPYVCRLPSGKTIVLFFYHGPIAQEVAFGGLLHDGERFANRLIDSFPKTDTPPVETNSLPAGRQDELSLARLQLSKVESVAGDTSVSFTQEKLVAGALAHIATDGETYGHHHRFGDMALAYCLAYIQSKNLAKITNYAEFLEKFPPQHEVEIMENTSWSCPHGIERWRANCGCRLREHHGATQEWRSHLRRAMDWLRDQLNGFYEQEAARYLKDPWDAREHYIEVILDRSPENLQKFFDQFTSKSLSFPNALVPTLDSLGADVSSASRLKHRDRNPDRIVGIWNPNEAILGPPTKIRLQRDLANLKDWRTFGGDNLRISSSERVRVLKLLEIQRHAMLMYTSCGWFFDDVSGIETVQILHYAARAIQLTKELTSLDLEKEFKEFLKAAPTNNPEFKNGLEVYERLVVPARLDLVSVGAHYALTSLFENYPARTKIYSYTVEREIFECMELDCKKFALGEIKVHSSVTGQEDFFSFAVLHQGEDQLSAGVIPAMNKDLFQEMTQKTKSAFAQGDFFLVLSLMQQYFGTRGYSLRDVFRGEQEKILNQILDPALEGMERLFRRMYPLPHPLIHVRKDKRISLPKALATAVEFILNRDLQKALTDEPLDSDRLQKLIQEMKRWSFEVDKGTLSYLASRKINCLIEDFFRRPEDLGLLKAMIEALRIFKKLPVVLNVWRSVNICFLIDKSVSPSMKKKAQASDPNAREWSKYFEDLRKRLEMEDG